MKMHIAKKQAVLKTVSFVLAMAITFNILSMSALSNVSAENADLSYNFSGENISEIFSELPDSTELESMYIDRLFYGNGISFYKDYGRTALDGVKLEIYEALRTEIEKTAAGENTETVFTVNFSEPYSDSDMLGKDISNIVKYLMTDLPQDFYWYDKTKGYNIEAGGYSDGEQNYFNKSTLSFAVSENYADKTVGMINNRYLTVNPSKINSAKTAVKNAQEIADEYSEMSDYNKILGYKNRICNLTEYNDSAADNNTNTPYGDPWQLVYVFDDDPDTNVVCEGYSKAFQYLCDLGGIECYTVTGTMTGGTGAGPHMWNIVVLDGKSYLVDITNCDSGSAGYPDLLLLKGASSSSSIGCTFNTNPKLTYIYDVNSSIYPDAVLAVSTEDYVPDAMEADQNHSHKICVGTESCPDDIHSEHDVINWIKWDNKELLPTHPGNYYLAADVTLTASWTPAVGETSLCLNGHTITVDSDIINSQNPMDYGIVYIKSKDTTFNLCDCAGEGKITGNTAKYSGGGVYSNYGTFNMYSGKISGNSAKYSGGGVYNNRGTLNMYGGEISGNSASENSGGGVRSEYGAVFNMYNGKINRNTSGHSGGGVTVYSSQFYMYDGTISGNTASVDGGGVGIGYNAEFYMYGGTISKNTAMYGGGVEYGCVLASKETDKQSYFLMLGGVISENTATGYGGGVAPSNRDIDYGQITLGKNAVIKNNTCNGSYNNLYMHTDTKIPEEYRIVGLDTDNPLTGDAYIGITMETKPADNSPVSITGKNGEDYSAFFNSDNTAYKIVNGQNNVVQLAVRGEHDHKVCVGAENCPNDIHVNHKDVDWQAWDNTTALPSSEGYYYLTSDVTLTESWRPIGDVSLCLNGHTVSAENAALGIILIEKNTTFNLCDCTGGGKISGNTATNNQCGGGVTNNGTFNMYSGEISKNKSPRYGGGVFNIGKLSPLDNSTLFNLYGGKIIENTSAYYGGGVSNNDYGIFSMYGGVISKNTANDNTYGGGGGVSNGHGAIFNMYDGEISENESIVGGGVDNRGGTKGNLYETRLSTFNMLGGKIVNNSADIGGGVNTGCQPDQYTDVNFKTFYMYGGEISNNSAAQYGGGVVCTSFPSIGYCQITLGGETVIKNNTCNGNDSNLYIPDDEQIPKEYKTITLGEEKPLTGNAYIGVTTEIKPTESSPIDITKVNKDNMDYSGFFHSDDPACEIINSKNNEVQLALSHVHSFVHIKAVKPTCTESGNIEYYVCENCFKVFADENGETPLPDVPDDLEALGHLYGDWIITVEPTEEEDSIGEAVRICEHDTSHIERVELKTLKGEMWEKIEDIPSTCENEGKRVYTNEYGTVTVILKRLSHDYKEDWQKDSEKHWQTCKNCGTVNPDSENPHIWDEGKIIVEPTAEHDGEKTFTCEICGYTRTEKIPKLEPPVTLPSETDPPVTPPSETNPPVTPPSDTEPPVTPPSDTEPPVAPPSETEPPVTPPSDTEPPVTPPSETEPPVTPPSETEPPVTPPSETEPPVTPPSDTDPPVTPPSETDSPVTPPSDTMPVSSTSYRGHFVVPETSGTTVTEQITSDTETTAAPVTENTTIPPQTTEAPAEAVQGSISKRVESPDYIAEMPDSVSELANNVLTPQEIMLINSGSVIEILLTIDKISTVSNTDGAAMTEVLNGFKMWQYLDINLYKIIDGTRDKISGTSNPVTIKINIPEALRKSGREYAMVRVHDGAGEMIKDSDSSADTITFTTDRFSVYALVYKDKEINEDKPLNTGVNSYTSVFLATGITALSTSMTLTLMGTGIMGMSEERKNKVYDKLIRWGKDGGKTRKAIALALIFLLLSYYYTIGVRVQEECKI